MAKCPRRYAKKQKDRVAGGKQEGDMRRGQCEAGVDLHIHRCLFILSVCFFVFFAAFFHWWTETQQQSSTRNCCIKMAQWKYFHLSIPIKLNHFSEKKCRTSMLCGRTSFVQRLKKLLNICFEWAKKKSTRHDVDVCIFPEWCCPHRSSQPA